MSKFPSFATLCLIATVMTMGCATSSGYRVDDALLSEVSADQKALIQEARTARDQAIDDLAKASRDTSWAEDQTELARAELQSVTLQLEEAKLSSILAERNGTTRELQAAKERQQHVAAMADATREKLALRKRQMEHMRLQEKVALERRRLADAEVELSKAEAVQELDRVAAQKVPLREFKKQVSFLKTEVALAEVRANAAKDRVDEAKQDLDSAEAKAASFKTGG